MPEVSVVMGVYNTRKKEMLEKSIKSVLSQSFGDFEFIICDDGSEESAAEFLRRTVAGDKRIKLLRNEKNLGLAATLNRCIDIAEGKYIFRQDDDDYSEPDRFCRQHEFLETRGDISLLGCNVNLFDGTGVWGALKYPEKPEKKDFLFGVPFKHGTVAFRKDSLTKAGGYLAVRETRRTEDYELFMRMYSMGFKGYNLQETLYNFREDKASRKRRKYRYRIDEAVIRYRGFKTLGILPEGFPYIIKPLIVGIIPSKLLDFMKDKYYKRRTGALKRGGNENE